MGRAGGVKGLDVEERVGPRPIEVAQHNVGSVVQSSAGALHELLKVATTARPLAVDVRRAEEGLKADDPRMDSGVVARARQAHAMPARAEVPVQRPDLTRRRVGDMRRAHGADSDVALAVHRRKEEEIDGSVSSQKFR